MTGRDRFLVFPEAVPPEAEALAGAADAAATTISKPAELSWWDWAVFLLHTAAEIEHALMVQYLYAAYSLGSANFTGTAVPPDAATRTSRWRRAILLIAKQEMGHLITEQNLLRFIGGPLNLDRQDFPFRTTLYPFPLTLRPLTRTTLATYVAAEMPELSDAPEIPEILAKASAAEGGAPVNRVGLLFDTLVDVFGDPDKLADADLDAATGEPGGSQTHPDDWHASFVTDMHVFTVTTRDEAVEALRTIGRQGEGPQLPPEGSPSHFDEFLTIYREFPEADGGPPTWVPTLDVPVDPTTAADPPAGQTPITDATSRLWAQLFNTRYRMLLTDVTHAMSLTGAFTKGDPDATPTVRGELALNALGQMTTGLRGIARKLTSRPLSDGAPAGPRAAPPFELPYTLALVDVERDRWRLHRALLDSSADLIGLLRAAGETDPVLDALTTADALWRETVTAQIP